MDSRPLGLRETDPQYPREPRVRWGPKINPESIKGLDVFETGLRWGTLFGMRYWGHGPHRKLTIECYACVEVPMQSTCSSLYQARIFRVNLQTWGFDGGLRAGNVLAGDKFCACRALSIPMVDNICRGLSLQHVRNVRADATNASLVTDQGVKYILQSHTVT